MERGPLFIQSPLTVGRPAGAAVSAARPVVQVSRRGVAMAGSDTPTSWEEYMKARQQGGLHGGTIDEAQKGLRAFQKGGGDMEFDGGDSGGGVVGDGNMDLEDQHNSPGMLREGFLDSQNLEGDQSEQIGKVKSAMSSRNASAGANYFGRHTGYADKKIEEISEEQRRKHQMDEVRAQQLENWMNQRALHESRKHAQSSPAYGGGYASTNYADYSRQKQASQPAQRRDGEAWGEVKADGAEEVTETFDVQTKMGQPHVTEIKVKNLYMRFMPFRVAFTDDSSPAYSADPTSGTMERNKGPPVDLVVRFNPSTMGEHNATLVFETEEFKFVYKFFGSTL